MKRLIQLLLFALFISMQSNAESFYRDFLSGFSDISAFSNKSGYISINNTGKSPIFETTGFRTEEADFYYQIRLKTNNEENKNKFLIKNSTDHFGIVWNYIDEANYEAISLKLCNHNPFDDIANHPYFEAEVYKITNNNKTIYFKKNLEEQLDYTGNYNSFCITYANDKLKFDAGNRILHEIGVIDKPQIGSVCNIGYFVAPKSHLTVKRIQYRSKPNKATAHQTKYTKEMLDSIFSQSTDLNEGYWSYYDRKTDNQRLKLGGKYKIAIVKNNKGGYDLLYVDGAIVNPDYWKPYMLKGKMEETPFIDQFNIKWIDSNKEIIDDEAYAIFSDNLFSIKLPIHKSEIRFYKINK